MVEPYRKSKSLEKTMIFAILIWGGGHVYLERKKRGILILLGGIALASVFFLFISGAIGLIAIAAYWPMQAYDAYKTYKRLHPDAALAK